ncbi:hypothetical protein [Streptomyces sp. NPDC047990]|uniref:hypothetical protein n=1 Tax=Streptomyces sp. NPDC047990 TaxID=3365496 RepID=UPI003720F3FC
MTPDQAAIVDFLRDRHVEKLTTTRELGNMLITGGAAKLGFSREVAEGQAAWDLEAAETRVRFFEETVVPYLGTAGPTGRIADQQLRLLAWEHGRHRDYDEAWRP